MAIIAPNQHKLTPLSKKVFPSQKELGEKRFSQTICKAMQANAVYGMSLRSLLTLMEI